MAKRRTNTRQHPGGSLTTIKRVGKYSLTRAMSITAALLVGVYLCVLAVNFGGFIDEIFNDYVETAVMNEALFGDRSGETHEETSARLNQMRVQLRAFYGLDEPFFNRSLRWYWRAVTFDWGEEMAPNDDGNFLYGDVIPIRQMILEYLPRSLLLFSAANLFTFMIGLFTALILSRKPASWPNKLVSLLTPLSSAPSWVYGILLVTMLPFTLISYPKNALIDPNYDFTFLEQLLIITKRLAWPVAATFISMFVQLLFTWRTFFMVSAQENHVEMATAMGLSPRKVERKYILRPSLITVITNFSMLLLSFWQSSLLLELLFSWPGIGHLFVLSFFRLQRNIMIGIVVTFAFMIALTVYILDFIYAVVDPRVRIDGGQTMSRARKKVITRLKISIANRITKPALRPKILQKRQVNFGKKVNSGTATIRGERPRTQSVLSQNIEIVKKSPLAVTSLLLVTGLMIAAAVIVIKIPSHEAIRLWRAERDDTWRTPELAQPVWVNFFQEDKLPDTIYLKDGDEGVEISEVVASKSSWQKEYSFTFDYQAAYFPQELKLQIEADYDEKRPFVQIVIATPDGRLIELAGFTATSRTLYPVGDRIQAEVGTANRSYAGDPMVQVFTNPEVDREKIITGEYQIMVIATTFEEDSDINVEFAILGWVYGLSGTDIDRHDMSIPLLWGLPIALVFGLAGAVLTSLTTMLIAATGTWFGGWLDTLIQRITEVNIMIPALPIAMTMYYSVSKSIWAILGVIVLLNIFSSEVKNYRAAFIQIKDMPYVEAAQAYGASNFHIIRHYLIPKIFPLLLPRLVFMVPAYVYLEASLAFLGVSGIFIPTWGKIILAGLAYEKAFYWAQPITLLVLTAAAFTMLGIALDKILNPALQDI